MSTAPVTHLTAGATAVTLVLIVGFVIVGGLIAAWGRARLEGSFSARTKNSVGDGSSGRTSADRTFMRSWLAISLVGGLLVFAAASFELDDTTLRSSLLGGVIASAGAVTAFYFASKSADQARRDILNASFPTTTTPNLLDQTKAKVNAALAGTPLYLDASPAAAQDTWFAVSQDPPPNQVTPSGSRVQVEFAGPVPNLATLPLSVVKTTLAALNLTLSAQPPNAPDDSKAQGDQQPPEGPPSRDKTVRVSFK